MSTLIREYLETGITTRVEITRYEKRGKQWRKIETEIIETPNPDYALNTYDTIKLMRSLGGLESWSQTRGSNVYCNISTSPDKTVRVRRLMTVERGDLYGGADNSTR